VADAEIDVGAFLGERMAPVVAPTQEIDPGPYVRGNLWLSFWQHVDVRETPLEASEIGRSLRALHDTLAEYRGPLPPRSAVLDEIDWLLNAVAGDDSMSELAAERDRLAEGILEHEHAADQQPIHGDASFSNLLATSSGPRWNDFEDVCVGTVEWDVAGVRALEAQDALAHYRDSDRVLRALGEKAFAQGLARRVERVAVAQNELAVARDRLAAHSSGLALLLQLQTRPQQFQVALIAPHKDILRRFDTAGVRAMIHWVGDPSHALRDLST
jgi:hypothetical protein